MPTLFGELRTAPYDLRYWSILKLLEEERQAAGTTDKHGDVSAAMSAAVATGNQQTIQQLQQLSNNKIVIRTTEVNNGANMNATADETCILGYLDDAYLRDQANVFEDWQRSSDIIKQVLGKFNFFLFIKAFRIEFHENLSILYFLNSCFTNVYVEFDND